jgi:hypothetical protein
MEIRYTKGGEFADAASADPEIPDYKMLIRAGNVV